MGLPWFKRIGIFFIPTGFIGWVIGIIGIAFLVFAFKDIDSRSHSVSDTMINFVFVMLIVWAVYSLVAYLTSRVKK